MSLKPWREVARPHKDVLEGTFKQSEFAADISQVVSGVAPPEYQDAEKFFSRSLWPDDWPGRGEILSFSSRPPLVAVKPILCWL